LTYIKAAILELNKLTRWTDFTAICWHLSAPRIRIFRSSEFPFLPCLYSTLYCEYTNG